MKPVFPFDHEARKQIRATRTTLLATLAVEPDDFTALVLAEVIGAIDPDRDATLASHRMRFRAVREPTWRVTARERGLDRLLFHLAHGFASARIGRDAVPILEQYADEISEARRDGVAPGLIDTRMIPESLATDPRVQVTAHASGHLARVGIEIDLLNEGELVLAEQPGSAAFSITQKLGGYGTLTRERYKAGSVHQTLNTPWHDGEDSSYETPWTKWVMASLDELASLAERLPAQARVRARRRSRA
jgi:hypothetical protein